MKIFTLRMTVQESKINKKCFARSRTTELVRRPFEVKTSRLTICLGLKLKKRVQNVHLFILFHFGKNICIHIGTLND